MTRLGVKRFSGGVFWFSASAGPERLEAQYHGALCVLRPKTPDLKTFLAEGGDPHSALEDALAKVAEPYLIVLDNVPEPKENEDSPSLEELCPGIGRASILVTSRMKVSLEGDAHIISLQIDTLPPTASYDLISEQAPVPPRSQNPLETLSRACDWVGHLPIALVLLNRLLRASALTISELREFLEASPTQALDTRLEALRPHLPLKNVRGIEQAFLLSYERLDPLSQTVLRRLAQLAVDPIPVTLFSRLIDESQFLARASLTSRSFLQPAEETDVEIVGRLHPLMADFVRLISDDPTDLAVAVSACSESMAESATQIQHDQVRACLPHCNQLIARNKAAADADDDLAENIYSLWWHVGSAYIDLGRYARSLEELTHATNDLPARLRQLRTRLLLGAAQANLHLNQAEAAIALTEEAETEFPSLPEEYLDDATYQAARIKADGMSALGRWPDALRIEKQLLGQLRSNPSFGPDDALTLGIAHNLGVSLRDLGQLPESIEVLSECLDSMNASLGPNNPRTLTTKSSLAIAYRRAGDKETSLRLQREVADARDDTLGPDHPKTLKALHNIGMALTDMGRITEAVHVMEDVRKRRTEVLGLKNHDTLNSMQVLADLYGASGRLSKAMDVAETALKISIQLHAGETRQSLRLRMVIATIGMRLGRINAENLRKACEAPTEALVALDTKELQALAQLARMTKKTKRYSRTLTKLMS